MSLKGIDAQIMVARTADVAREAAVQAKGGERMQDFLAVQAKAMAEREQSMVSKLDRSEKPELRAGDEGSGAQDSYTPGGGGRKEDGSADEILLIDPVVPGEEHLIDIWL